MSTIGARIVKLKEGAGISRARLADLSKVSAAHIYEIELNRIANPGVFTLEAIAHAFGISLQDLLGPEEPSAPLYPPLLRVIQKHLDVRRQKALAQLLEVTYESP